MHVKPSTTHPLQRLCVPMEEETPGCNVHSRTVEEQGLCQEAKVEDDSSSTVLLPHGMSRLRDA